MPGDPKMMVKPAVGRAERKRRIAELEGVRGRRVICYVTSTREKLITDMAMDVIAIIHRHLRELDLPGREEAKLDLLIHSYGGDGTVPGPLMALLRQFASEVDVLVPHCAFSAATLTALGADNVIMHRKMAMLGPIDPQINDLYNPILPFSEYPQGIQVENVKAFKGFAEGDYGLSDRAGKELAFQTLVAHVHPLALGNISRHTKEAEILARNQLLLRGTSEAKCDEILANFASKFHYHNRPITFDHAVDHLALDFVKAAPPDVEETMWSVYEAYEVSMKLDEPFTPVVEALRDGLLPPSPKSAKSTAAARQNTGLTLPMRAELGAVVESMAACDWYERPYELTLSRDWAGRVASEATGFANAWVREADDSATSASASPSPSPTPRRRRALASQPPAGA